jgi:hypothetical protein
MNVSTGSLCLQLLPWSPWVSGRSYIYGRTSKESILLINCQHNDDYKRCTYRVKGYATAVGSNTCRTPLMQSDTSAVKVWVSANLPRNNPFLPCGARSRALSPTFEIPSAYTICRYPNTWLQSEVLGPDRATKLASCRRCSLTFKTISKQILASKLDCWTKQNTIPRPNKANLDFLNIALYLHKCYLLACTLHYKS